MGQGGNSGNLDCLAAILLVVGPVVCTLSRVIMSFMSYFKLLGGGGGGETRELSICYTCDRKVRKGQ